MTPDADPGPTAAPLDVSIRSDPPPDWDDFVRAAERASFCHLAGWRDVLRTSLRLETSFLTARSDGELHGVMPVVRMPRLGPGTALISMPYLNYGGPLGTRPARSRLVEAAVGEAERSGARRLEIRSRQGVPNDLPPGREKVTVLLDLPDDPDTLFTDRFRSKLRSQIRRPMKEGMEARFGPGEMEPFYEIFAVNMRDLGTPVLPRRLFEELLRVFPDEVDFGTVYHEGTPVAGGCGFHYRDEFEMTWASSLREYSRMAPNMLLYWSFMERCIERGRETFNFGRCTPGGGTHRFKGQWGGEDEPL
ncbi:MAG: GNAT family N-acetyltransferase, partial [Gemmatimonadota bacterium]